MDYQQIRQRRLTNLVHTGLILTAMFSLFSLIAWVVLGSLGLLFAAVLTGGLLLIGPRINHALTMRALRAQPVSFHELPTVVHMVNQLSARAGLLKSPRLYLLPGPDMNAFATGTRDNPGIAISEGCLTRLSRREVLGVLAHEVAHVANNDAQLMALSAIVGRLTHTMAFFGQILLLVNLSFWVISGTVLPWLPIIILIAAPYVSMALQFALSRTREFEADLGAVRLSQDPRGLASALLTLEASRKGSWLQRLLVPKRLDPEPPSWMRSHPHTHERVRRLMNLEPQDVTQPQMPLLFVA